MASSKKLSDFFQAASGHRLLNSILSSPPKGIIIVDLDGNIMFANAPMNQALSPYKQGLRNQSLYDLIQTEEWLVLSDTKGQFSPDKDTAMPLPSVALRHCDGTSKDYTVVAYGIFSESGELECVELNLERA